MHHPFSRLSVFILFAVFGLPQLVAQPLSQQDLVRTIDSLRLVQDMPYICDAGPWGESGCGDNIFWNAVKGKKQAVPILIEQMADSSLTAVSIPNFGGRYAVGDVAFAALEEIVHGIPSFDLLPVEFDPVCGGCRFWRHLRTDLQHRIDFQERVREWWRKYEGQLVWVESEGFANCDCYFPHPNGGHYALPKQKP